MLEALVGMVTMLMAVTGAHSRLEREVAQAITQRLYKSGRVADIGCLEYRRHAVCFGDYLDLKHRRHPFLVKARLRHGRLLAWHFV